jgi:hypothetical protein
METTSPRSSSRSDLRLRIWSRARSAARSRCDWRPSRPDVFRSLSCHEPPLWGLLERDPGSQKILEQGKQVLEALAQRIAEGDHEGAARQFVDDVALGPGAWENVLPPEGRAIFINNAPTFLDELRDPDALRIEEDTLSHLEIPIRLTDGSESAPVFRRTVDRLAELIPQVARESFEGAALVPQLTIPERFVEVTTRALRGHEPA